MMTRRGVTQFLKAFENATTVFFDAETDLLIVLDAQGNIRRVNPAFERVLQRDEASVLGVPIVALVHQADLAAFIHSFSLTQSVYPFRLLCREPGAVLMEMIAFRFRRINQETGRRGYLILRPRGKSNEGC